jgi:hypothetical protein
MIIGKKKTTDSRWEKVTRRISFVRRTQRHYYITPSDACTMTARQLKKKFFNIYLSPILLREIFLFSVRLFSQHQKCRLETVLILHGMSELFLRSFILMFADLFTSCGLLICFLASSILYVTNTMKDISFYDSFSHSVKRVSIW